MSDNRYTVEVSKAAKRTLRRLPKDLQRRLIQAAESLGENPRPHGCTKLEGDKDYFRMCVGDWRIIYSIQDDVLVVVVVKVASRGKACRDLS